jgi:hypothetical protein
MAPDEDCLSSPKNQPAATIFWHPCRARRPRNRDCLLKGCEREFRPQQPLVRYCREACREQARQWRAWKARRRYRQSANGKQKRRAQSCRYRERRKLRPEGKAAPGEQREGHPCKFFFMHLRSSGVLCGVRSHPAIAAAAILFSSLPARSGAGSGTGTALVPTAPSVETAPGGKKTRPAPIKTCRYRPDILQSPRPPR